MDFAPDVEMGSGFDALLDNMDETQGLTTRRRLTLAQAQGETSRQERQQLLEYSATLIPGPPTKMKRLLQLMTDFADHHTTGESPLGDGLLAGNERRKEGFVDRLKDYVTLRVIASQKFRNGQPVLIDGKKQYMSTGTLLTLLGLCMAILPLFPFPSFTAAERIAARSALRSHALFLARYYGLHAFVRKKTTLGHTDVKGLVETLFEESKGYYDVTCQTASLLLVFFYTGARPGSILRTAHYPQEFLSWKDISFLSTFDEAGEFLGFEVHIKLSHWKGFHTLKNLEIIFKIRCVQSVANSILDLGTLLFAHGARQGVFGGRTIDSIIASKVILVRCDPAFERQPVFLARSSRTSLDANQALNDKQATLMIRNVMTTYGVASGKDQPDLLAFSDTLYAFRRNFATWVTKYVDPRFAKFFLGHQANSTMLEARYDQGSGNVNLTEGLLGPQEHQTAIVTPLSLQRTLEGTAAVGPTTLKDALEAFPEYRHFAVKRALLRECLRTGSSAWKTVSPFKEYGRSQPLSQAMLPVFIARFTHRLNSLISRFRQQRWDDAAVRQQAAVDMLTYEQIRQRREEADAPSDMALLLQRRLLEQERLLVVQEDPDHPDEVDAQDTVIDVPAAGAEGEMDDVEEEAEDENDPEADELASDSREGNAPEEEIEDASGGYDDATGQEAVTFHKRFESEAAAAELPDADVQHLQDIEAQQTGPATASDDVQVQAQIENPGTNQQDAQGSSISSATLVARSKLEIIRTLTALEDSTVKQPCPRCRDDATADNVNKAKKFIPGSTQLQAHIHQYHSKFKTANRFMEAHLDDTGRWICPFGCADAEWAFKGNSKGQHSARWHVVSSHQAQIDPYIYPGLHPDTRAEERSAGAQGIKEMGWVRDSQAAKAGETDAEIWSGNNMQALLGTSYMLELGLTPSDDLLDFDTDAIPDGLLDGDGIMRL